MWSNSSAARRPASARSAFEARAAVATRCSRSNSLERTLHLPRLPAAWDGLTILHLSDLHLCGTPDRA